MGTLNFGMGMLDFRTAVGDTSTLLCQTCMTSIEGLGRSRVELLHEIPFLLLFRRLGDTALLASRFDMERKGEKHVPDPINTARSENLLVAAGLEPGVCILWGAWGVGMVGVCCWPKYPNT